MNPRNKSTLDALDHFFAEVDALRKHVADAKKLNDANNSTRMEAIGAKFGEIADAATRHRVSVLHSEEMG